MDRKITLRKVKQNEILYIFVDSPNFSNSHSSRPLYQLNSPVP